MGTLNNKRSKAEVKQNPVKEPKEEQTEKKTEEVLYIQLEPFTEVSLPNSAEAIK